MIRNYTELEETHVPKTQVLSPKEERIVSRGLHLFDIFSRETRTLREEIVNNRKVWNLEDPNQDGNLQAAVVQLPTLISNIENAVADQMDNMPDVNLLPETPEGQANAEQMNDVVRYILDRRGYPAIHRELMTDELVAKACVIQTFWDETLDEGKGDINLLRWPLENFYWDTRCENIQEGRACFKAAYYPMSWFREHYPDQYDMITPYITNTEPTLADAPASEDENIAQLLEYWYRVYDAETKKYTVHVAFIAGKALLYCSEIDSPEGVYAHGMYPFDLHTYRKIGASPVGKSMVDDFIEVQRRINRLSHYVDINARMTSKPKFFVNKNGDFDKNAFTDWNQDIIEVNGPVGDDKVHQFQVNMLNPQVAAHMQWLIDLQKNESGQNQSTRGEFGGGVTAASAIQALQEAGGKISRMRTRDYQSCFASVITKILWLMSQFYTQDRVFVITGGENNKPDAIVTVNQEFIYGEKPAKDALPPPPYAVQVVVQRMNPQRIDAENQMALQMAQMYAQNGTPMQVSGVIDMLNIPGKDRLRRVAEQTDARNDQILMLQQQLAQAAQMVEQQTKEKETLTQLLSEATRAIQNNAPVNNPSQPFTQNSGQGGAIR